MSLKSIVVLTAGLLVFGMGMAAAHQLRVAVTDMFPPSLRAEALGYLALGSIAGLALSPILVATAERIAPGLGQDPLALPWLMLPVLIVTGMVLVTFIRPDPKEIGQNLAQYFPGVAPPRPAEHAAATFSVMSMLRRAPIRRAIVANAAGQGNMAIVMVLTSLVLHHHGHSLTAIAFSHMFHTVGMFGFTIPLGRIADRFGREQVMYPGVAIALVGAVLVDLHRRVLVGHARDLPGRARLGGRQCRLDRADRGPVGDARARPRHRRQRQRRRGQFRHCRAGDRAAGAMERIAGRRAGRGRVRGGSADDAGGAPASPIARRGVVSYNRDRERRDRSLPWT